ncbi:MAG: 4a-hydroxytetrahydrobiopterin dehydratase, partial [Candidatus Zixiibacteriota bacterium]
MSGSLRSKKCVPSKGGIFPLSPDSIKDYLNQISGWTVRRIDHEGKEIATLQKQFQFKNFRKAMAFLREVEDMAESEGHHPDFCGHYNKVDFTNWTHANSGLHDND